MDRAYEPVSLGAACETKFQISRKLYREFYGGKSELGFRMDMKPPHWGQKRYKMHMFDWQDIPFESVCRILEQNFDGVFERKDLIFRDGFIVQKELNMNCSHLFEAFYSGVNEEYLSNSYAGSRVRFDHQASAFKEILASPGPFLYIYAASDPMKTSWNNVADMPSPASVQRLVNQLTIRSPDHDFHVLILGPEHDPQDYKEFSSKVTTGVRPGTTAKSKMLAWEGDDAGWDEALAPYKFVLHDRIEPAALPVALDSEITPPLRRSFWRR